MKILFYKISSPYRVLDLFSDELAAAFIVLGHDVVVINYDEPDYLQKVEKALYEHGFFDFAFSFSARGLEVTCDSQSLYDALGIPFVTALVDHPFHLQSWLNHKIKHLIVACIDEAHLDFLNLYYTPEHIKVKLFMPPAGTPIAPFTLESLDVYVKERTIPLLFAGTYLEVEKVWLDKNMPFGNDVVNLLNDTTDHILAQDCISITTAFDYVLERRKMDLSPQLRKKAAHILLPLIYWYIWGYCRMRVLTTLADAQIPMTIYDNANCEGEGYLAKEKYNTITFKPASTYEHLLKELKKTRLSLNTTTNLLYGASERVFSAMLNGAVSVSQANFASEFIDRQNCVLYQWTKLDELPQRIFALLENPQLTWQIAQNASQMAKRNHTWLNRAQTIIKTVSTYKDLQNLAYS